MIRWGATDDEVARPMLGDELIDRPTYVTNRAITIEAPPVDVWPWLVQIGELPRAGFYSYQWLENVAGCAVRNAERVHAEWQVRLGDPLWLHPRMPPLTVVDVAPGRWFVAHAGPDRAAQAGGRPWAEVTWLFLVEPLGPGRCRFVSRYRCACSPDLATRLALGPTFVEPVGFAMDRRMLLGVKARAERGGGPPA